MFSIIGLIFLLIAAGFVGAIVMALRGGRFSMSRVIGDAFVAIWRAPIFCIGCAVLSGAVPGLAMMVLIGFAPMGTFPSASAIGLIFGLAMLAWYQLLLLAMVMAALDALDGKFQVSRVIARTLPLLPQALLTSLIYWLAVLIGFSVIMVPGIILACMWMLVLPVIAAEPRVTLFGAFARSAKLTRGVRWHLFLLAVIGFVFAIFMQGMIGALSALLGGGMATQIVFLLLSSLLGALPPAIVASAYRAIVAEREGPATRDLEQIFA